VNLAQVNYSSHGRWDTLSSSTTMTQSRRSTGLAVAPEAGLTGRGAVVELLPVGGDPLPRQTGTARAVDQSRMSLLSQEIDWYVARGTKRRSLHK
jgi:hypothetical protein